MRTYFTHSRFSARFLALTLFSMVLFVLVWSVAYYFLPEAYFYNEINAGATIQQLRNLPLSEVWLVIVIHNLLAFGIIIFFNFLLQVNDYPAGYLFPVFWAVYYGLLIGTNSFILPMEMRMAPSLAVLTRAGPYEITSYLIMTTATFSLPRIRIRQLFRTWPEFVIHPGKLSKYEWLGMGSALLLTLCSAWLETVMFQERLAAQ